MTARILVVDLLGGLGDMIMLLPSLHALAEAHPGAGLTVLTHAPSDVLLAHDPAVTRTLTTAKGTERDAVARALDAHRPDLVVTTTRFDGIGDLVDDWAAARGARSVSNLWRRPPPDELVGHRYQRILAAEGVIASVVRDPVVVLTDAERAAGRADLDGVASPVVLVPDAGMAVKRWPQRRWVELARRLAPRPVLAVSPVDGATTLPPTDLRRLAARFAAVAERDGVVVGPDTGPVRLAAAAGARTVGLFGPTAATRYGLEAGENLQGLPGCAHRRPTAITEQVCWWHAECPLATEPACLVDIDAARVAARLTG